MLEINDLKKTFENGSPALKGIDLKINNGTKSKLRDFSIMIQSFQVLNESYDVFQISEHVAKKTGLLQELKKDGTPEGIARIENIEELLNGMRDFVEEQKEIDETTGINKLVQRKIPQQTICDGKIVYRMINLIN